VGIPPQRVVGSSVVTKYEARGGKPAIVRQPELDFIDDKAGKPVAINKFIGRRPIAAFGNSDGDFEMLEWVTSGPGASVRWRTIGSPTSASWLGGSTRHRPAAGPW
jgi:hypothetical protein